MSADIAQRLREDADRALTETVLADADILLEAAAHIEAQAAEIARLRKALDEIAGWPLPDVMTQHDGQMNPWAMTAVALVHFARAAREALR